MNKKKDIILLKTLLLSTSQRNIYRYCTDKKKKRKIIGGMIGTGLLYIMLMAYCIAMCVGYGTYGLISSTPVMCALVISGIAFFFTFFKTNGYLFNFREYDMLMSLPFEAHTVAACKFAYMYIKSLPWYLSISLSMMAGYGYYARPKIYIYPVWILLSVFLPLIPMLLSAFLGFLLARFSAGFRKTNLIQTILTFVLLIFCFCLRFILEGIFKNDQVPAVVGKISSISDNSAGIYLPARWFADAITKGSIAGILLLTGVSTVLFVLVFFLVGRSYRNINSALKSHAASGKFRMSAQKKHSVRQAIAFKEFRRLTGSTVYMTNAALGEILAVLLSIVTLFIGFDRLIAIVTQGAPIDASMLQPAIPFVLYFLIGMMATTACSPSLEGKNYWILQSLPIEKKTIYQGKMLFHLYLSVPVMVLSTLCLCISAKTSAVHTVLYVILGIALCAFSTAWGCVCGIRHMRLDWENEVEVIKQGSAVTIYLLPNMLVTMGLVVLVVFLGTKMDHALMTLALIAVVSVLALLSYLSVIRMCSHSPSSGAGAPKAG